MKDQNLRNQKQRLIDAQSVQPAMEEKWRGHRQCKTGIIDNLSKPTEVNPSPTSLIPLCHR